MLLWQHYLTMEPRGEKRSDYHAAQITHAVYSFMLAMGNSKTKISLEDNLLKFKSPFDVEDPKEIKKRELINALAIARAFGAKTLPKLEEDINKNFALQE